LISGSGRTNLDRAREGSKSSMADFQKIQTERKALDLKTAGIIGQRGLPIMVGLADDLHRALRRQASWVRHFQAKFARVALRKQGTNQKENNRSLLHCCFRGHGAVSWKSLAYCPDFTHFRVC